MDSTTSASPEEELRSNMLDIVLTEVLSIQVREKTTSFEEVEEKRKCSHGSLVEFIFHEVLAESFRATNLKSSHTASWISLNRYSLYCCFLLVDSVSTVWIRTIS